ncbi:MAG TPA: BrnA antitoxin family protein [Caulobacteraceae bacterium]|nr:BrnA antitoxin family protein [Caulobacteraceae bacterium]
MSDRPFTPEELKQLVKLEATSDKDIDTSDIPEITDEQWARAFRPGLNRPIKQPITIRLDADIVGWFKEHAGGGPYQREINRVLRQHVANARRRA